MKGTSRHRDRISDLPDELLCHILSLLPTKHAVTTSVISKRRRPLWLSVPTLHFDEQAFSNRFSFLHFVYAVFLSRDTSFPVRSFRLKCRCSDVSAWVQAALQRGVETLELEIPMGCFPVSGIKLPSTLINCRTLTTLTLKGMRLASLPHVDLPRLKTLRLENVFFDRHVSVMKLLSGCPVLEDLLTDGLYLMNQLKAKGEVECLLNLVRADVCTLHLPLTLFRRVEFLRVYLVNLHDDGVPTFHKLTHLEFCITPYMPWEWLVAMLEHCPKLQNLVLHKHTLRQCSSSNLYEDD